MISFIRGELTEIQNDYAILEHQGMGFQIFCTLRDLSGFELAQSVKLHTVLIVREDDLSLYGFLSPLDRTIFNRLRSVSGIGTKTAMNALHSLNGREVIQLVMEENDSFLTQIPGIGKKTAARIILELKDSFRKEYGSDESILQTPFTGSEPSGFEELKLALSELGYDKNEIRDVLRRLDPSEDLQNLLRQSLTLLARW